MLDMEVLNERALYLLQADMQTLAFDFAAKTRLRSSFERVRDEVMRPSIDTNFERGGRPEPWEPITLAAFQARKSTGGGVGEFVAGGLAGSVRPLDDTGQLRKHATAKARFHIKRNSMTYGRWPARRWWGPVHDLGSRDGTIPQRQFVGIQPEDATQIGEILMEWVEERVDDRINMVYV